jgi:hypothetical protein
MSETMTPRGERIAHILSIEVARILRQLGERRVFLLQMWSRHRAREPFLDTLFSRYRTLSAGDLAELEPEMIEALELFYEAHGELVSYIRFTEDMPVTLEERFDELTEAMAGVGEAALEALGALETSAPPQLALGEADEG